MSTLTPQGSDRILVTGNRSWTDTARIHTVLTDWRHRLPRAVLIHGDARGADHLAAGSWAGWQLPTEAHPTDWTHHGHAAGPLRNQTMVALGARICLAFLRNTSPGASHCAALTEAAGIPTHRFHPTDDPTPGADMTTTPLRDWALYLATQGWHVFPLTPGAKRPPLIRQWEQRATTDAERITRCWHGGAAHNIGIATGPSRLIVLDLDPPKTPGNPDGTTGLATLAHDRGVQVPPTYTVSTPRGGTHLYFTTPPGVRLRNTESTLAPHLDTRAHGGYIVGPGSLRPDGAYELVDDTNPAELPAWLVQALTEPRTPTLSAPAHTVCTDPGGYVRAALRGETNKVRHAPPGQHNRTLSRAAYALGQLIGADLLNETTARAELTAAAGFLIGTDCDCTNTEIARVINAGLDAGARNPRRATPRTSTERGAA